MNGFESVGMEASSRSWKLVHRSGNSANKHNLREIGLSTSSSGSDNTMTFTLKTLTGELQ